MALYCLDPYSLSKDQADTYFDLAEQRWKRRQVACGRCDACVINRKQDWAGKLLAEAAASGSVTFLTLTYAKEPSEFAYKDFQKALNGFRMELARKHGKTVRYFVVGEFGEKLGRRHWHALFFFSRPFEMPRPAMNTKWKWWPHGWANIQNLLRGEDLNKRVRYCCKYAAKGVGVEGVPRPRGSLKPSLGAPYLMQLAVKAAAAGLLPQTTYTLPGVFWRKGKRKGQHETFRLRGGCLRAYLLGFPYGNPQQRGYVDTWLDTYPDKPLPYSPEFDKLEILCARPKRSEGQAAVIIDPAARIKVRRVERVNRVADVTRWISWGHGPSRETVRLSVNPEDGFCGVYFSAEHAFRWEAVEVKRSILEVLPIAAADAAEIDDWIKTQRGPDYGTSDERAAGEPSRSEKREARGDFAGQLLVEEALRRRLQYGTTRSAAHIYDPDWQPKCEIAVADEAIRNVAAECGIPEARVRAGIGNRAAIARFAARVDAERAARFAQAKAEGVAWANWDTGVCSCDGAGTTEGCPECGTVAAPRCGH